MEDKPATGTPFFSLADEGTAEDKSVAFLCHVSQGERCARCCASSGSQYCSSEAPSSVHTSRSTHLPTTLLCNCGTQAVIQRIIDLSKLEGTLRSHLIQLPCNDQGHLEHNQFDSDSSGKLWECRVCVTLGAHTHYGQGGDC